LRSFSESSANCWKNEDDFFAIFQWLPFFQIHKENELCFRVFIFSGPDPGLGEKSNVLHLNFGKLDFRRAIFWILGPPGALGSPPEALEFRVSLLRILHVFFVFLR